MIIECTNCHSKYQYEKGFEGKASKKIRCAKCQQIFEIFNPDIPKPSPSAPAPPSDRTMVKRQEAKKPAEPVTEAPAQPITAKQSPALQLPVGKRLSLAIIDGPDAGRVVRVEKPRLTIGRSGADLTLNDSDASRQHAALEVRETSYTLQDLGSTNGTLMEGQKISAPVELQNHSEFVIGSSTLMLIVTDDV